MTNEKILNEKILKEIDIFLRNKDTEYLWRIKVLENKIRDLINQLNQYEGPFV